MGLSTQLEDRIFVVFRNQQFILPIASSSTEFIHKTDLNNVQQTQINRSSHVILLNALDKIGKLSKDVIVAYVNDSALLSHSNAAGSSQTFMSFPILEGFALSEHYIIIQQFLSGSWGSQVRSDGFLRERLLRNLRNLLFWLQRLFILAIRILCLSPSHPTAGYTLSLLVRFLNGLNAICTKLSLLHPPSRAYLQHQCIHNDLGVEQFASFMAKVRGASRSDDLRRAFCNESTLKLLKPVGSLIDILQDVTGKCDEKADESSDYFSASKEYKSDGSGEQKLHPQNNAQLLSDSFSTEKEYDYFRRVIRACLQHDALPLNEPPPQRTQSAKTVTWKDIEQKPMEIRLIYACLDDFRDYLYKRTNMLLVESTSVVLRYRLGHDGGKGEAQELILIRQLQRALSGTDMDLGLKQTLTLALESMLCDGVERGLWQSSVGAGSASWCGAGTVAVTSGRERSVVTGVGAQVVAALRLAGALVRFMAGPQCDSAGHAAAARRLPAVALAVQHQLRRAHAFYGRHCRLALLGANYAALFGALFADLTLLIEHLGQLVRGAMATAEQQPATLLADVDDLQASLNGFERLKATQMLQYSRRMKRHFARVLAKWANEAAASHCCGRAPWRLALCCRPRLARVFPFYSPSHRSVTPPALRSHQSPHHAFAADLLALLRSALAGISALSVTAQTTVASLLIGALVEQWTNQLLLNRLVRRGALRAALIGRFRFRDNSGWTTAEAYEEVRQWVLDTDLITVEEVKEALVEMECFERLEEAVCGNGRKLQLGTG